MMNCLEVMSQAFPYQRYHPHTKKYDLARMHEASPGLYEPQILAPTLEDRYSVRRSSPPLRSIKQEDSDREQPKETHYLNANCVLFTYFSGDISQVVDDHFTRALSQTSSYNSPGHEGSDVDKKKEISPMTQRNFPPSFWNSHYHPLPSTSHHDLQFSEPCSSLQLQDPWHYYPLSSTNYSSRTVHDFSYASMSGSRFNSAAAAASHYKSALLMQPRSSRFASSSCDLNKPTDAWAARYHSDMTPEFSATHLDTAHVTGLETVPASTHDPTKDLYWF